MRQTPFQRHAILVAIVFAVGCSTPGPSDGSDNADAGSPAGQHMRVFVTSMTYNGDLKTAGAGLDGIDGADQLCNGAAANAGLVGTWKAWLSDSATRSRDRLQEVGGWKNVSGTAMVFASTDALYMNPENWTSMEYETGDPVSSDQYVYAWTGPGPDDWPCEDWTTPYWPKCSSVGLVGGGETGSGLVWESGSCQLCTDEAHLYCFEQ